MKLDRNALEKLLTLNDAQLKGVMEKLAADSGLDLKDFNISAGDISAIRNALSSATDDDIARASEQINNYKKGYK